MSHLRAKPAKWWKDATDYPPEWATPLPDQGDLFDDDGQDMASDPGSAPVSGSGSSPSA